MVIIDMTVEFLEPAEFEFKEAVDYYNDQNPGLGIEFSLEVKYTIERIIQYPDAWFKGDIKQNEKM